MSTDIASLVAGWRDAERRLYPLVLSDPGLYERCLLLIRAVADELHDATTVDELAQRFEGAGSDLAIAVARRHGISTEDLDTATLALAGFSIRHAEILRHATGRPAQWPSQTTSSSPGQEGPP